MSEHEAKGACNRLLAASELVRRSRRCSGVGGKLALLRRAVELAPTSLRVRIALARALACCGRDCEAVAEWERVLELARGEDPGSIRWPGASGVGCRELVALLWRAAGDSDRARWLHQQAIRWELEHRGSLSGRTLLNAITIGSPEMPPGRIEQLLRVIAREGARRERAEAWLQIGRSAARRRVFPEALRALRQATKLAVGPRARGEALAWYGCLLVRSGRLARGERILRQAACCLRQARDQAGARRLIRLARRTQSSLAQRRWMIVRN